MDQYFEQILHSDHVKKGKPDPEVYLAAAAAVNVLPKNCIVFEDAPAGVRAAEAAGMPAFVILTTHHRDDFKGLSNIKGFIRDYWDFEIE